MARSTLDPNAPTAGNMARIQATATAASGAGGFARGLASLAANLAGVPGRKSVVVFSAGYALTPQLAEQLNHAEEACNRSDVALYPVDVGGLTQPDAQTSLDSQAGGRAGRGRNAAQSSPAAVAESTEQILYNLAGATGGYVSTNTNSLLAGLMKIVREQTGMHVSCGHEVARGVNYRIRAETAVLNARIIPCLEAFIDDVRESLHAGSLFLHRGGYRAPERGHGDPHRLHSF